MYTFDTVTVLKMVMEQAETVAGMTADTQNPESDAKFPRCIVQPPLQRPKNNSNALDLSFTIEVWAEQQFDCIRWFDAVRNALAEINLIVSNNTPLYRDAIGKWRYGGYFECRWNALTNSLERNR